MGSRLFSLKFVIFILLVAALVPIAYVGWTDLYVGFLEKSPPIVQIIDPPRGIGLAPVSIQVHLLDEHAGLDEVVVRIQQRGPSREILKKVLDGKKSADIEIRFQGDHSGVEEGVVQLEIKAFDRSIWSNRGEATLNLKVDYRKPKVEVLSAQHNARHGGAEIVFYKAFDEDMAISGVKVGNETFLGFPAVRIDSAFQDPSLWVALYAVDLSYHTDNLPVRIFAEDTVGNAVSIPFYNKIQSRGLRHSKISLTDDFMRDQVTNLADQNFARLQEQSRKAGETLEYTTKIGSPERLVEKFEYVTKNLRDLSDAQIVKYLNPNNSRFDYHWGSGFALPRGSIQRFFGELVTFTYGGDEIGELLYTGHEFSVPRNSEVIATGDGIVTFSENIGFYGSIVAIDHGLGLFSLYGHLENARVSNGNEVKAGDVIGTAGQSGFARNVSLYYETRIQGVPVDSVEWWDKSWFKDHITAKIEEVKRTLGLPVYRRLE